MRMADSAISILPTMHFANYYFVYLWEALWQFILNRTLARSDWSKTASRRLMFSSFHCGREI